MKNFKLLLATTAILSMCAVSVMATYDTEVGRVTINSKLRLVQSLEVSEVKPLLLGVILNPQEGQTLVLDPNEEGPTGNANVVSSSTQFGEISVDSFSGYDNYNVIRAHFPTKTELKKGNDLCGEITYIPEQDSDEVGGPKSITYGASLTLKDDNPEDDEISQMTGLCTGTGVVTFIYEYDIPDPVSKF